MTAEISAEREGRRREDVHKCLPVVRPAPWVTDCVVVCPIATVVLLVLGEYAWGPVVSVASFLTVLIAEHLRGPHMSPGYIAEALSLILAAAVGALPPAVAMGAAQWRGVDKAGSIAALFPVWLAVMLSPAGVVYEYSANLDPTLHRAHLAANFIFLFSAAATAIALAYTIWVRHHPDAFVRNRVLPKRRLKRAATGGSTRWSAGMADGSPVPG